MAAKAGKPAFIQHLERNGLFGSVVSIEHLQELKDEIDAFHRDGALNNAFYHEYEKPYFSPKLPRNLSNAKSIIIAVKPQPMLRTTFNWKGEARKYVIPPTYFDNQKVTSEVRRLLVEGFRPESHRLVRAVLPLKLLAARSGLALYGKNNITYVPKYGSFHRLTAFYSDYASPTDFWQEKKSLPLCDKCKACLRACPTGAIQKDRFLIKAEICLTYLNEKDSNEGFPRWVDASAHNSLVGCMRCQRACPYDEDVREWYEDRGSFTEDETAYLLKGRFTGPRGKRIQTKLRGLGLDPSYISRNLKTLLLSS
jgi:epoxyqueuosine reductase